MPTVIDELIVTLGLDPSQFKKEAAAAEAALQREKDAALKRGKEIEASGKKQARAFDAVAGQALKYLSVLAGAGTVGAFFNNTVKTDAAVGRLSDTLAVSTREISTWQAVMRETGGSTEDASNALQTLVDLNTQYRLGTLDPARAGLLARLGVTPNDLREPTKAALAMASAFERLDPRVAADYARRLGFSPAYINTIKDGRKALADHIETAKLHGQITQEDADKAEAFQRSLEGLKTSVVGLGRALTGGLLPPMTEFFTRVTRFLETPNVWKFITGMFGMQGLANSQFLARAWENTASPPPTGPAAPQALTPPITGPTSGPANRRGSFALAVAYWKSHGYTDAQARGMAAGMSAETGGSFDPGIVNPKSGAYGIGQWMGPRRADFKRVMCKDIRGSSWGEQMAFMQWELTHAGSEKKAGDAIRNATTEAEALRQYIGSSGVNGKGAFGFMRPRAGAEVAGDLSRGRAALAANPAAGTRSTTVSVGTVVVNTRATDAAGIARDMSSELRRAVPAANVGMQ